MSEVVRSALSTVVEGGTLTMDAARAAMGAVMDGEATPAQLAALLVALRMRGETVEELAGFAAAMRDRVLRVDAPDGAIDIVGTGGDRSGTFNISTTAALVVAGAGVPVAKHGNRAITSRSGSADVLEALGVRIDHDAESAARSLRETGFAFLFAPGFNPAMRHAGPTRKEIGIRTAFNLLGPLTNPAGTRRQVIGVGDAAAAGRIARVAELLGTERTLVVHGAGVDELPLDGTGVIHDVGPDGIVERTVDPALLGLGYASLEGLAGGSPEQNAALVESILGGEEGPRRDAVLLNAGAAFVAAGRASELREGIEAAAAAIDSGSAMRLLERLRAAPSHAEVEAASLADGVGPGGPAPAAPAASREVAG
jgi:anthranilate phosphoribosyltransferase